MALGRPLLKVAAKETIPWVYLIPGVNNTLIPEGPLGKVLKVFSEVMNFDFQIVQPLDNHYGAPLPNGSWTGMIGMVYREEAEFSIGPFSISPERANVTSLTTPVYHTNVGILTVRPTLKNDVLGFLKPFSYEVWLCTLCSILLISFFVAIVEIMEARIFGSESADAASNSWQWALKAITQEGSPWIPKGDGARVLVATWLLASLVFVSSFSGILTAMLTVPKVNIPVDSLEDLVSQKDIPWRMVPGTFILNFLKESDNAIHQKAFRGLGGKITSCFDSVMAVARGDYAIICEEVSLLSMMEWDFSTSGSCHTYKASENVYSNNLMAMAFRIGSPYFGKATNIIAALKESGILQNWFDQRLTNATNCLRSPTTDRSANEIAILGIQAFAGSLLVLVGGYFLSLLIFLWELLMA